MRGVATHDPLADARSADGVVHAMFAPVPVSRQMGRRDHQGRHRPPAAKSRRSAHVQTVRRTRGTPVANTDDPRRIRTLALRNADGARGSMSPCVPPGTWRPWANGRDILFTHSFSDLDNPAVNY